jgi:proline iminopeptidase
MPFQQDEHDNEIYRDPDMARAYAMAWDQYVRVIPKNDRKNMAKAYHAIFEHKLPETATQAERDADEARKKQAAAAYTRWEGTASNFKHVLKSDKTLDLGKFEDASFAAKFARIESHYMANDLFLSRKGKRGNYILDNLDKIAKADHQIPIFITHGAQDQDCRLSDAVELAQEYENAGGPDVWLATPDKTGHSMIERGNVQAIMRIMKELVPKYLIPRTEMDGAQAVASGQANAQRL